MTVTTVAVAVVVDVVGVVDVAVAASASPLFLVFLRRKPGDKESIPLLLVFSSCIIRVCFFARFRTF